MYANNVIYKTQSWQEKAPLWLSNFLHEMSEAHWEWNCHVIVYFSKKDAEIPQILKCLCATKCCIYTFINILQQILSF